MTINKLTATFGKLKNQSLTLNDGLNVIYAPNESGKSTWCAFIRAMLYGVESSQRAKNGVLPDKQRYAPWSGESMGGTMALNADGKDISITRTTKLKNAPMREFSAVYTGTNVKVDELTGVNAGEALTGVSREVFVRSAFIAQGDIAVASDPELEKRIASIVSSGDETVSFSDAETRLKQWQHKRRYNRRGLLPELETKMEEEQNLIKALDGSGESVARLEQQLEAARSDCIRLEAEVTESRRRQRRESLELLSRGRAETEKAQARLEKAQNRLDEVRLSKNSHVLSEISPENASDFVNSALARLEKLSPFVEYTPSYLMAMLFLLLCAAGAGLFFYLQNIVYIIFGFLFGVCALVSILRENRKKGFAVSAFAEREELLDEYDVKSEDELRESLAAYLEMCEFEQEALAERKRAADALEVCRAGQKLREETALSDLDFASGNSPAARLGRELRERRAEAEGLNAQLIALRGRLSAMGDLMVIKSELESDNEKHREIQGEYDAISLALEALRAADTELQSRFSPALGRKASEYMKYLTGGRYESILINRDLSAVTRISEDSVSRAGAYLSAGTLDLMYLSLRLAVCALALPEGKSCPLIIDDALVNLDEERLARVMELLGEISKERQVILFTCRR